MEGLTRRRKSTIIKAENVRYRKRRAACEAYVEIPRCTGLGDFNCDWSDYCAPIHVLWTNLVESKVIIVVLIITYGGLCYRILLLPIDFLLGPVCRTMYCSGLRYMAEMHTCRAHCPVWKFYYGSNIVVSLLDPKLIKNKDIHKMQYLPKDVPLTVTFYRLSGIIIQIAGSGTNTVY